jgi:hypothetical protein
LIEETTDPLNSTWESYDDYDGGKYWRNDRREEMGDK